METGLGAIIYTDIPDFELQTLSGIREFEIDLNRDNTTDFVFRSDRDGFSGFSIIPQGSNRVFTEPNRPPDLGTLAQRFDTDEIIHRSILSEMVILTSREEVISPIGNFDFGPTLGACGSFGGNLACVGNYIRQTGFVGVEFSIEGETHYGYIEAISGQANGGILYSWAYESEPGKAILAGTIPEPSTSLYSLMGIMITIRRKR
jgi:hypothetical protein